MFPTESPTPREALRDMIADALHRCACMAGRGDECHGPTREEIATAGAVVGMFPEVGREDLGPSIPGVRPETITHTRFVLRTAPTAAKRPGEAGSQKASKTGDSDV